MSASLMQLLAQLTASIGVLLLLLAFTLNLTGRLERTRVVYELMNFLGAGLSCFAALLIGFIPFVVLEGCWAVIAAIAIFKRLTSGARGRKGETPATIGSRTRGN